MSLKGKIALVTGGSRGIGAAIALTLAKEGADIAITYVSNPDGAKKVVEEAKHLGVRAISIQNDIRKIEAHQSLVDQVVKEFGHIDILVNNAGVIAETNWSSVTSEEFDKIFETNAKAPLFLIQKAVSHIPSGGSIINLGSAATKANGTAAPAVYAASKFAATAWAVVLAKDLGAKGIRINTLAPGFTNTDMLPEAFKEIAKRSSVFNRLGEADDIANIVAFLADSKKSGWITGQHLDASGGGILQF
jgi:3-oxoacyl-[acyl-carrier protein] reductase